LADLYGQNITLSTIICDDMTFLFFEQSLRLLNPWVIKMDIDASKGNDSLSEERKNKLLKELQRTEQNMAVTALHRRQFDLAEGHC
jgi:hypothetical protein